ncbi:MAG: Ig-like domain-containing protein [Longimicrobiales bacterium]
MRSTIRATAITALLALLATGCDIFGPGVGPPAQLESSGPAGSLTVGQTVAVSLTVRDGEGRVVEGETVTWTASGGGTASPASTTTDGGGRTSTEWTLGTTAGTQSLTAAAGAIDTTFSAEVAAADLAEIDLSPTAAVLESLGDTLELTAGGSDPYGNAVDVPGLNWSSSDPGVASVADGGVVSHAEGSAEITATAGTLTGTATVTVDQVLAGLQLDPDTAVMVVAETLAVSARGVDARGFPIDTTLDMDWTTSDPDVATVSDSGVVTSVAVGTTTILASAGSFDGEAAVEVRSGSRPTITSISPSVLGAGDTAMIRGTSFGSDTSRVQVSVGDVETSVLTVTDTLLTTELPAPGTFPCAPAGDREIVVSVDGLDATASHPVAGASRHTLGVGGSVALFGTDVACNELTEPGTYVMSVFNTSTIHRSATAFRLQGTDGGAALADGAILSRIRVPTERSTTEPDPELEGHLRMLERNRRLVEELGPPESTPALARTAAQQVGDIRTFRIPDLDEEYSCPNYIEVDARAVYTGTYGVIWEDTLAPLAGTMDADWDSVGTEYDTVMHQILLDYFGDPLAYDDRLDNNGLFFMLFSEAVNDYSSMAVNGFVFSGDFYPRTDCASSDHGEIFYGRVPTASGSGFDNDGSTTTVDEWLWRMRSTVIHEVKHLTAYANKFDVGAGLEDTGLEEATARLAEEFYGRALQGYGQLGNVGYDASIYCERLVSGSCAAVPIIMHKHFNGINAYLKTPALLSPFGPVDSDDSSFYGSGWQWVRWAIDQSGVGEAAFIKPLVREPELTGPANLADKAGRSVAELLADYTLAFAIDDHPSGVTPVRNALTLPGWDTRDIFQGLHDAYASNGNGLADVFPTPWPLATRAVSGSFQVDVPTIHGGAATLFELDGMTGAQLLELLSGSGGTAPASLGLSIVRIQ